MLLVSTVAETNAQPEPDSAPDTEAEVTVRMTDGLKFDPEKVTVEVGQTVKWINEPSTVVHTVTADTDKARNPEHVHLPEGAETFDSGRLQPGDVFTHTFDVPGRYKYFCIPHERAGMTGEVEVTAAGEEPQKRDDQGRPAKKKNGEEPIRDRTVEQDRKEDKTPDPGFVFGAHAAPRPPEHREATGFWKFVYWLGNFHPAATDVPVGIILAAFLSEVLLLATGKVSFAIVTRYCVWVGGIAALGTAALGWCLAGFQFYDNAWMLTTHRILGTVTGVWGLALIASMEAARSKGSPRWQWTFRTVLLIATLLIIATGFFGGAMIYGLDHYSWPDGPEG